MNKWMKVLKIQNMFGQKRKTRGFLWASLIGIGVSAVTAFGVRRKQNNTKNNPLENIMNTINKTNYQTPGLGGITEFSDELIPKKDSSKSE